MWIRKAKAASARANRKSEGDSMTEAELANSEYWAHFWDTVEHLAFLGVVVTLAIEFMATKFASPHKELIESAQNQALEDRKQENLKLSLQLANVTSPRRLSADVSWALIAKLRDIPKVPIQIATTSASDEVMEFAAQIGLAFRMAGWQVESLILRDGYTPSVSDVAIQLKSSDPSQDAIAAHGTLTAAFKEAGIVLGSWPAHPSVPEGAVRITVGEKSLTDRKHP
jgi:hypothetical protein